MCFLLHLFLNESISLIVCWTLKMRMHHVTLLYPPQTGTKHTGNHTALHCPTMPKCSNFVFGHAHLFVYPKGQIRLCGWFLYCLPLAVWGITCSSTHYNRSYSTVRWKRQLGLIIIMHNWRWLKKKCFANLWDKENKQKNKWKKAFVILGDKQLVLV